MAITDFAPALRALAQGIVAGRARGAEDEDFAARRALLAVRERRAEEALGLQRQQVGLERERFAAAAAEPAAAFAREQAAEEKKRSLDSAAGMDPAQQDAADARFGLAPGTHAAEARRQQQEATARRGGGLSVRDVAETYQRLGIGAGGAAGGDAFARLFNARQVATGAAAGAPSEIGLSPRTSARLEQIRAPLPQNVQNDARLAAARGNIADEAAQAEYRAALAAFQEAAAAASSVNDPSALAAKERFVRAARAAGIDPQSVFRRRP